MRNKLPKRRKKDTKQLDDDDDDDNPMWVLKTTHTIQRERERLRSRRGFSIVPLCVVY
jgi:hypothetical protein